MSAVDELHLRVGPGSTRPELQRGGADLGRIPIADPFESLSQYVRWSVVSST